MLTVPSRIGANLMVWKNNNPERDTDSGEDFVASPSPRDTVTLSSDGNGTSVLPNESSAKAAMIAELKSDPKVRAALGKVPGMNALKLETLTKRDIQFGAMGAIEQARMLKSGETSVEEMTQSAIRRAQAGAHLGFIDRPLFDDALAQAKRMDQELKDLSADGREALFAAKPLFGVPTTFKANLAYKGIPTTYGSQATGRMPQKETAQHLREYLDIGMVPICTTDTSEFGFNGVTEPVGSAPTVNPHNTEYTAGGSSGGAAVSVSAGIVALGLGTDGGGSGRIPASMCGTLGFKPSRHRWTLLKNAEKNLTNVLNMPALMTRDMSDLTLVAHLLDRGETKGMDPLPHITEGHGAEKPRVGFYLNGANAETDPEVIKAVLETVEEYRVMGYEVVEVTPPHDQDFEADFLDWYRAIARQTRFALSKDRFNHMLDKILPWREARPDSWVSDPDKLEPFSEGLGDMSFARAMYIKHVGAAQRLNDVHTDNYENAFEDVAFIISPTISTPPPKVGELSPAKSYQEVIPGLKEMAEFATPANAAGGAAMSIPGKFSQDGLPIGVQLSAGRGQEEVILRAALDLAAHRADS
jgi:amidase